MTKPQRRDKELSANGHRETINASRSGMERAPALLSLVFLGGRGNVNLACACCRGKVATKARRARIPCRLYAR